jgi:hypothetical protein
MELFQNISINEIRAFWFVRKLGFKGFEGRPRDFMDGDIEFSSSNPHFQQHYFLFSVFVVVEA